ncbi:GNAT family N-acetyltransferase [Candidatus Stoquefichus massiliensis]|uniref:GNAT family N-acetyltransferase n=1 Tax=Candidatus Stoquefichus massiliensis TaxID=1470350 RepID=UPI0004B28C04|nr:GNAT family protein [Candidatus Stoquefichus massiliensis]
MTIMNGDKVKLRPIIYDDVYLLNKWKNTESVYKYLGGGFLPTSIDIQKKWMENMMNTTGSNKRFIIESDDKHEAIGMIGLYEINWINRTCELGVFIGECKLQGSGYGKEACRLIENYAFDYLNLRKIKLSVVEENIRAVRMYQSLGYVEAGRLHEERFIDGHYCSLFIMEKLSPKISGGGYEFYNIIHSQGVYI